MPTIFTPCCLLLLVGVCLIGTHSYAQEKVTFRPHIRMACLKVDRTCAKDSECCSDVCFTKHPKDIGKCWPMVSLGIESYEPSGARGSWLAAR
jgi:hypothetical protein